MMLKTRKTIRTWCLCVACVLCCSAVVGADDHDQPPSEPPPSKPAPRGFLDALTNAWNRNHRPEITDAARRRNQRDDGPSTSVHAPTLPAQNPEIKARREQVDRLSRLKFSDMPSRPSPVAARRMLERLRQRAEQMRAQIELADTAEADANARRWHAFNDRWSPVAEAVKRGDDHETLRERVRHVLEQGGSAVTRRKPDPSVPVPVGRDALDAALAESGLGHLAAANKAREGGPSPEKKLSGSVAELAEMVKSGRRPAHMDPQDWSGLSDLFERDLAELEAADYASAYERRKRRAQQLAPIEEALRDAEAYIRRVENFAEALTPKERRFFAMAMAWRLHQARLAQARQRLRDAEELARERRGEPSDRKETTFTDALGGAYNKAANVLTKAMRKLDTDGHGPPPPSDQLAEGLPFPEWFGYTNYKDRVEAQLRYYGSELAEIEDKINRARQDLEKRDAQRLRFRLFQLETHDRLRARYLDEEAAKQRQKKLNQYAKELKEERDRKLETITAPHRKRLDYLREKVRSLQERLDKMIEADTPTPSTPEIQPESPESLTGD